MNGGHVVSSSTRAFHRSSGPTQVNRGQLRSNEVNDFCRLFPRIQKNENTIILNFMTSGVNHWPHLNSEEEKRYLGSSRAIWCFCRSVISIMVSEILTIIWRYTRILGKFDLWWPLVTSILTLKKMTQIVSKEVWTSYRTLFFFFSLPCLRARLVGWGFWSPPRTKPSHLEPARNRVNPRPDGGRQRAPVVFRQ